MEGNRRLGAGAFGSSRKRPVNGGLFGMFGGFSVDFDVSWANFQGLLFCLDIGLEDLIGPIEGLFSCVSIAIDLS